MEVNKLHCEDMKSSRRMQGKRSLATYESCQFDLKDELPKLYLAFSEALSATNEELSKYNPLFRCKTLEASIMQTFIAQKLQQHFPGSVFFGKYKRLVLRIPGYLMLFKKLNTKGYPMNIKTSNVQSILNQQQTLDLFSESDYNDEPILYFGYQKNKLGEYVKPQVIYIDDNKLQFSLDISNVGTEIQLQPLPIKIVQPAVREDMKVHRNISNN